MTKIGDWSEPTSLSGYEIQNVYDKNRLVQIQTPEGNIDFTYICGMKVGSISKGTESISYAYDGKLRTSETLSGILNQTLSYGYNNDFNLQSFSYAGNTQSYSYDDDGLLTGSGSFAISRNAVTVFRRRSRAVLWTLPVHLTATGR